MRRNLSQEQRRRIERLVRAKGERCGVCGNPELRSGEDAASNLGGGYSVTLRCTNALLAEDHAGGIGLVRDYSITPDEARQVGLG
jgi:hypothetical protein